jgi:hypothetical protein
MHDTKYKLAMQAHLDLDPLCPHIGTNHHENVQKILDIVCFIRSWNIQPPSLVFENHRSDTFRSHSLYGPTLVRDSISYTSIQNKVFGMPKEALSVQLYILAGERTYL